MPNPVLILTHDSSLFCKRLASTVTSKGQDCLVRSLDAPFEGGPVTVGEGRVAWEGVNLPEMGVIFLEHPLFSWPQPARLRTFAGPRESGARALEREARSLSISALLAAESSRPVVNRVGAGFLCSSRAAALDELEGAGVPVHPWRVAPASRQGDETEGIVLDLVGGERWHRPVRPEEGHHALMLGPVKGDVIGTLVVAGTPVGARRYASLAAWSAGRGGECASSQRIPPDVSALAVAAAARLDLEIAEVWIGGEDDDRRVLLVEAGPDLAAWDIDTKEETSGRIAERLIAVARS